jgi:endoglucanase
MHVLRSHHFNAVNEDGMKANTLFGDPAAQQHLADLWVELSHRYGQIPVSELAYEIMNEPVADDHEDWNKLVALVFAQIRAIEPDRVIVIGANRWQIPSNVPYLKFPEGDKNIIISFHTYSPMLLTHYKAEWTPLRIYEGPVNYPGAIITPEAVIELKADLRGAGAGDENADEFAEVWGPERLLMVYAPAIKRAHELGLQLYCGEFGCMPTPPREARLAYYRDIVSVFEANGIAWANWEYKGDFGIFEWHGPSGTIGAPDMEMIDALMSGACKCEATGNSLLK